MSEALFVIRQQYLSVGTVIDIVLARDHLTELLKAIPFIADVELICVTPDIEDLRRVGFERDEFLTEVEQLVPLNMMIHGRIKDDQIGLQIEIMRRGGRAGIFDAGVVSDEIGDMLIHDVRAAGIRHTDDLVACNFRKSLTVFLDLTNDFLIGYHR